MPEVNLISPEHNLHFLKDGGEMGELTRQKDWSKTSLGSPELWPQSLRTTINIVLNSRFPMFLFWGPELICFYNNAYRPSLGQNGKHPFILGMKGEDAWPEIWHIIQPLIAQVISGGGATWSEDQLIPIFRNNQIEDVYWTFSYSPIHDNDGKVNGVLVICNETTDKINTLRKTEESEERFRTMAESSEILIALGDETGNATYFNKAWTDLTGKTVDHLLKFGWVDLVHPEDKPVFLNIYMSAFKSKTTFSGEFRILSKEGDYRWLLAKGPPRFRADGSFAGYISSSIDITELKQADLALNKSKERFRNLIMVSPTAMALFRGPEFIVEVVNSAMAARWEYRSTDFLNKKLEEVFTEIKEQRFLGLLKQVYETGITHRESEAFVPKEVDGQLSPFYVDFEYAPFLEKDGTISGILTTVHDVTDKVLARINLQENEKKLTELSNSLEVQVQERTAELEEKNNDLERINKDLQSFAYISSHDLQEPLRKIQTFSSRIQEKEFHLLTESGKDSFGRIKNAANRMQALIDDLLIYSRTKTDERKFVIVDLKAIVDDVKEDLKEEIEKKKATIVAENLCEVNVIPFQFRQLMYNLISNSLKFSHENRPAYITIKSEYQFGNSAIRGLSNKAPYCHISITDNGIGFEPQYQNKIFEVFQRLHGKTEYVGTGIGLAIVKRIVENHNGHITAKSELDKGATFDIYIPSS